MTLQYCGAHTFSVMHSRIDNIVSNMLGSYQEVGGINHLDGPNLPSRDGVESIIRDLESIVFPGFQESDAHHWSDLRYSISELINRVFRNLVVETQRSICFRRRMKGTVPCDSLSEREELESSREEAERVVIELLEALPGIRRRIQLDVEAAFRGDPASKSHEEVILAYPGVEAIMIHRIAHELWIRDVPLLPRMMSESLHGRTGIDIHPGATIGDYFFIDHATGVVIGETTVIGRNVKIYQGVTLGALSVKKEEANKKRHPTIEDDVTIYAGATILGGETTVGAGSVIGGNVWITSSVPPGSKVYNRPSEYVTRQRDGATVHDFQI